MKLPLLQRCSRSIAKALFVVSVVSIVAITACSQRSQGDDPSEGQQENIEEPALANNQPEDNASAHPLLFFPGIIEIQNVMPSSGVGEHPRFEWQTVDGAELYGMVIFEPDGTPYWAWREDRTWVYLGGIDEPLPEENEGPIIIPGMTWQVVAYDGEAAPIAAGGPWPIAP